MRFIYQNGNFLFGIMNIKILKLKPSLWALYWFQSGPLNWEIYGKKGKNKVSRFIKPENLYFIYPKGIFHFVNTKTKFQHKKKQIIRPH